MHSGNTKILEFNQYQKSDNVPLIIYADLECVIETIDDRCKNNSENSFTTKLKTYSIIFHVYNIIIWKHRK